MQAAHLTVLSPILRSPAPLHRVTSRPRALALLRREINRIYGSVSSSERSRAALERTFVLIPRKSNHEARRTCRQFRTNGPSSSSAGRDRGARTEGEQRGQGRAGTGPHARAVHVGAVPDTTAAAARSSTQLPGFRSRRNSCVGGGMHACSGGAHMHTRVRVCGQPSPQASRTQSQLCGIERGSVRCSAPQPGSRPPGDARDRGRPQEQPPEPCPFIFLVCSEVPAHPSAAGSFLAVGTFLPPGAGHTPRTALSGPLASLSHSFRSSWNVRGGRVGADVTLPGTDSTRVLARRGELPGVQPCFQNRLWPRPRCGGAKMRLRGRCPLPRP